MTTPSTQALPDLRPQIPGVDTSEPSLRDLVHFYYEVHFSTEEADKFTAQYFEALDSLRSTSQPTDAQIREVFLANGFTVKEGQTDLKPYVFRAARALLALGTTSHPADFPTSILAQLQEIARGPWENAQGESIVEDAKKALAWLDFRATSQPVGVPEGWRAAVAGLVDDVDDLIGESSGVYGLHLNGDPSPWDELVEGGRFERLTHLEQVRALLTASPTPPAAQGATFEVHIAGPDDVIPFADELSAHRHANAVNKQHVADCLKHPDDHVMCVATVHEAGKDAK